ncbi:MAG: hypothetical protein WCK02_15765 [Bacteroidota bacterium]
MTNIDIINRSESFFNKELSFDSLLKSDMAMLKAGKDDCKKFCKADCTVDISCAKLVAIIVAIFA